jgi:hypothetical protein
MDFRGVAIMVSTFWTWKKKAQKKKANLNRKACRYCSYVSFHEQSRFSILFVLEKNSVPERL